MKRFSLIVVGAGPAGFCAAVAAGRLGVQTLLVEQYGTLGGAMTVGGVPYPMNFATEERQVIAGIGWELMERLMKEGWARGQGKQPYRLVDVDIVMAACEMDRMAQEAGVELLLNCKLCKAEAEDGKVIRAAFAAPEGLIELEADLWIDATGDGQLAALSGAAFEMGDEKTGEVQPGSLCFWMDGYDVRSMKREEAEDAYRSARNAGVVKAGDYYGENAWGVLELFKGHGLNKNHVEIAGVSAESRTAAAVEGRERIRRIMNWAKHGYAPASGVYGAALSPEAWPRESRRILGRSYITAEDYRDAVRYRDGVCFSYYPMDIHKRPEDGKDAFYLEEHSLTPDKVASIPLGAMIARDFSNLMMAGRCISGDRMAQSAYRVQATCMGMGQAAGVAAALQIRAGEDMNNVDVDKVRETLRSQGAIVPE